MSENRFDKALEKLKNGEHLSLRSCSICGSDLSCVYHNNEICFNSNCNCVNYWVDPRPANIDDFKKLLEHDEVAKSFGVLEA